MKSLFDYSDHKIPLPRAEYKIASTKKGSKKIYPVMLEPDFCACASFEHNQDCIHVQKARKLLLLKQNEYLKVRSEKDSSAVFPSFENVMAIFVLSKSVEVEYLACLFLGILYNGEETTDALYMAVGGQFQSDPRIIGVVTRVLIKHGLIEPTGQGEPSRRKRDHGDWKLYYRITPRGREVLEGTT